MTTLADLKKAIGDYPERTPLNPSIREQVDCGAYVRFKITYDVEVGDSVAAYLLVPKGIKRAPAVFCHHQHGGRFDLGKSEVVGLGGDPDQALGPELAHRGFVVLAPDAIGFEERNWSDHPGFAQYHELTSRLVLGQTLLAKVLHDISVGIDFLEQSEWVDPNRIGFIGHSYGGRMAIWAPAFDTRIRASVSNCGCIGYKDSLKRTIGIQAEFCVPGILEITDIADIARLVAPRALYISAAERDKYSLGAEELAEAVSDAFPKSKFLLKIWSEDHAFTYPMRACAYQFLQKHL